MLIYFLICLSISLAGTAGLQFFYITYLGRMDNYHRNYIRLLEKRCKHLTTCLNETKAKINEQKKFINSTHEEFEEDEEIWADVIEDR